ncbi:hypothetical protein B0H14DRAFT_2638543 [Mycena olivaceomarginata]|nr:hypothetical protein B0H14DRAFT_2638543 [Mycena olivaceomarginata]
MAASSKRQDVKIANCRIHQMDPRQHPCRPINLRGARTCAACSPKGEEEKAIGNGASGGWLEPWIYGPISLASAVTESTYWQNVSPAYQPHLIYESNHTTGPAMRVVKDELGSLFREWVAAPSRILDILKSPSWLKLGQLSVEIKRGFSLVAQNLPQSSIRNGFRFRSPLYRGRDKDIRKTHRIQPEQTRKVADEGFDAALHLRVHRDLNKFAVWRAGKAS